MRATEKLGVIDYIVYQGRKKEIVDFCAQFKEDWEKRFYYDTEFSVVFAVLPDGDQSVTKGDIIVRNALGEYFPVDITTFNQIYVPHLEDTQKINN